MSEMVERVAMAILDIVPPDYGMSASESEVYARAAIAAMREPTKEMVRAGETAVAAIRSSTQPAQRVALGPP